MVGPRGDGPATTISFRSRSVPGLSPPPPSICAGFIGNLSGIPPRHASSSGRYPASDLQPVKRLVHRREVRFNTPEERTKIM